MAKIQNWWQAHRPTTRRLVQLYAALLQNAHLRGFAEGKIYTGPVKAVCVPGLNCYSCPGAVGACPLGALQNAIAASANRPAFYVVGLLLLFGLTLGRVVCGWLCPVGLIQEGLHRIPTPKLKKNRYTRVLSYLKYDKPYIAFGCDLLTTPDSATWAVNYLNGIYQYVEGDYVLQFDGEKSTALYHIKEDWLMRHNLIADDGLQAIKAKMERRVKAIIQSYMQRMNENRLTIQQEN